MIRRHHHLMWDFSKSFLLSLRRPVFAYLTTLALTIQIVFAAIIYWFEKDANANLSTYFDAFYFTVTVMTGVGLGDIAPITVAGRAAAVVMMLLGTAIFVCFTGALAVSILQVESEQVNHRSASLGRHSGKD